MDKGTDILLKLFEVKPETRSWFNFSTGDTSQQIRTSKSLMLVAYRFMRYDRYGQIFKS